MKNMEDRENIELSITINFDMKEVDIRNGIYSNYAYECRSLNEVGEIVQEFIDEYIKGE